MVGKNWSEQFLYLNLDHSLGVMVPWASKSLDVLYLADMSRYEDETLSQS